MKFAILGPLQVSGPRGRVEIAGKRRRTLLLRLLVSANSPVETARLCDDLWDGQPPPGAPSTLRSHLSVLRKLLPDQVITASGGSVVLSLGAGELDSQVFETELGRGREALAAGNPQGAIEALESALSLWRGSALVEVSSSAWSVAESVRLNELRTVALETSFDARLALGQHSQVVTDAEALLREFPFREHVAAQLMLALYRSGRQADALAVCQGLRTRLVEELGLSPGAEVRTLESAILAHEPALDLVAGHLRRAEPVGVSEGGPPASDRCVPLPARLSTRPATGEVIGREEELELLAEAYRRVSGSGGMEVVLVSGEAGGGKTTLVAEAARAAYDKGACVLFGHCEEDLFAPYQLFSEMLGHYVAHTDRSEIEAELGEYGPDLVRLVPSLEEITGPLPPSAATDKDSERYLLFSAVVNMVTAACRPRPVVLVADDLQWASRASLQLLRHIVGAMDRSTGLLVLATHRVDDLPRSHPLVETVAALHRQAKVSHIELGGLDEEAVASYVESFSGHKLNRPEHLLARGLYEETDGNPFFVSELLRYMTETGALRQDDDGWHLTGGVPDLSRQPRSLRMLVDARVGRLGGDAESVLGLASVLGRDFDLEVLVTVTGRPEEEVIELLERASSAMLVREWPDSPGRYSFSHALIHRALYQELGPTRRGRAHRRVAVTLEQMAKATADTGRLPELARHWYEAKPPLDQGKNLLYCLQAADAALAALAPGDALVNYRRAHDLLATVPDADPLVGIDVAIGLGTAQRQSGDPGFRTTLLEAARLALEAGDRERLVQATLANDRGIPSSVGGTVDSDKVRVIESCLELLPQDHPERARVLASLCQEVVFESSLEHRQSLADEAIVAARASGDDATVAWVLNRVAFGLLVPDLLGTVLEWSLEALEAAERAGDPVLVFWAAIRRQGIAICAGDVAEADRCLELAGATADRLQQPMLTWMQTVQLATRALFGGQPDEAERLAQEAYSRGLESGQPDAELVFHAQLMTLSWERGSLGEITSMIEEAASANPMLPALRAAVALSHCEGGRAGEAIAAISRIDASHFGVPTNPTWAIGIVSYAEAALAAKSTAHAASVYERLLPWGGQFAHSSPVTAGPLAHSLGQLAWVLGQRMEAESHLARSAQLCEVAGASFFAARTELCWGQLLADPSLPGMRAGEDAAEARKHLKRAAALADKGGYAAIARRSAAALASL